MPGPTIPIGAMKDSPVKRCQVHKMGNMSNQLPQVTRLPA